MKLEVGAGQTRNIKESEDTSHDLHLRDLLVILAQRRRLIAISSLGTAILSAIIVLLIPSQYTATTTVMPPDKGSSSGSALLGQIAGAGALASVAGSSLGIKNPGDMYVSLFRSRTVEDAVIKQFGLMARYKAKKLSTARTAFEHKSSVVLGAKDGLIRITVTDRDPRMASRIANGYVDQFRALSANLAITEASQRRAFFQQQLLEAKGNLTQAEEALKRTEQSTGVLQIDSQARSLIESAAQLRAQIVSKEVQLQAIRTYATEQSPDAMVAEQELAALEGQLAKLSGPGRNSAAQIIVPGGKVPEAGMEYLQRLRDVKYYETISEMIARQFEIAKLDEARQGAIIQVVDPAVPPDTRSFPKRTLTVLLATMLALLGTCGWSVFSRNIA
jgi:uncharacterized protein involved in exopolysaccharide biosynthesis